VPEPETEEEALVTAVTDEELVGEGDTVGALEADVDPVGSAVVVTEPQAVGENEGPLDGDGDTETDDDALTALEADADPHGVAVKDATTELEGVAVQTGELDV